MYSTEQEFVLLMDKFRKIKPLEKIIENDLTFAEVVILDQIINLKSDVTVSNLSESLNISKAAISKLVTSIEQKGYISKKEDIKDKRISHIIITPKGKEVVEKTFEHFKKMSRFISEKMGEDDLKQLVELLKKLYNVLDIEKKERGRIDV